MTDTVALEEILSKFAGNTIDSKEFLNLLLTSDENGIDYLQNLKKEFKDDYVNPVFKKVKDHYKKIDNKLNDQKAKNNVIDSINDPLDIVSLNKEYKQKTKKILDKKLKDLSDNLKIDTDANISNGIRSSALSSVIPKQQQQAVNEEQKTFTPKENVVSLSEGTMNRLVDIFGGINPKVAKTENEMDQTSGGGLLESIGKFLLVGGVAAGLISMFWDSHIKPWLEEKLDMKLDFLDRFEGAIEGISKFFTVGGLKLTGGWLFNIVGKAFTTFGELLEGSLSAIFKLGFGDDVIKEGAKAAPAVWKTLLPKVAGGLFKGVGLASLKAIPIIGALISFYFAYDRFQKDDTIGGIIDILNGIVGFIPYAGVPLSLGLSALNAFLDYKAGNVEGLENQQSMKMDYVKKIGKFITEIPIIGGLIKGFMGLYKLGTSSNINDVKGALDDMQAVPIFGILPSIIKSVLDVTFNDEGQWQGYDFSKVIKNIKTDMLKTILKWFPEWFGIRSKIADLMGIKLDGTSKDPFSENTTENKTEIPLNPEEIKKLNDRKQELLKQKQKLEIDYKKSQEEYDNMGWWEKHGSTAAIQSRRIKGQDMETITKKMESERLELDTEIFNLEEQLNKATDVATKNLNKYNWKKNIIDNKNPFGDKQKEPTFKEFQENPQKFTPLNQKDFSFQSLMTNSSNNSILFDKNTNTANILDKEDNILAYKKDGVFDVALQELTKLVASINKGIYKIPESLENIPNQSPVVVSGGGGQQSDNSMAYVLGGARDPIYEFRRSFRTS